MAGGAPLASAAFLAIQAAGVPSTLFDVGGPLLNFALGLIGEDAVAPPDTDGASLALVLAFLFGILASGIGVGLLLIGVIWFSVRALVGRRTPRFPVKLPTKQTFRVDRQDSAEVEHRTAQPTLSPPRVQPAVPPAHDPGSARHHISLTEGDPLNPPTDSTHDVLIPRGELPQRTDAPSQPPGAEAS